MFAITLIFSGIAMFLNGFLPLIDENDNNEVVIMNVISGVIVTLLSLYGIFISVETGSYLLYGSALLFGATSLYISAIGIWDLNEKSLGWFSAIVTVIALALGIFYLMLGEIVIGVLWLVWMLIWLFYFLSRGLNVLEKASNFVIMLVGAIGLTAVGIMLLTGILII